MVLWLVSQWSNKGRRESPSGTKQRENRLGDLSLTPVRRINSSIFPQNCSHGQIRHSIIFHHHNGLALFQSDSNNLCGGNSQQNVSTILSSHKKQYISTGEKKIVSVKPNQQTSPTREVSFKRKVEIKVWVSGCELHVLFSMIDFYQLIRMMPY